ncbi:hypothetical protein C5167_003107 [Papaver somniferum]|uniref:Uncharacterized protein n=1 Tax=Papaver somniferum TaxID=3469 RepID=A0A4Y7L039_PAPSO|nr:hypothetical protein C5167_003107 [Papaver somniferum]
MFANITRKYVKNPVRSFRVEECDINKVYKDQCNQTLSAHKSVPPHRDATSARCPPCHRDATSTKCPTRQ